MPEDIRATEAETMILPRTPDEALVVDVARALDSGSMIEQAHRIPCMQDAVQCRLSQGGRQC